MTVQSEPLANAFLHDGSLTSNVNREAEIEDSGLLFKKTKQNLSHNSCGSIVPSWKSVLISTTFSWISKPNICFNKLSNAVVQDAVIDGLQLVCRITWSSRACPVCFWSVSNWEFAGRSVWVFYWAIWQAGLVLWLQMLCCSQLL